MTANNLIKKLVLLCVFELILGALICFAIPADSDGYIAAIQDKKVLLSGSKSPRIIFVGGSSIAFGLNSELIENKFNLPVINFGLHTYLGLETSLNIIEKYVAKGDIIVIIPEYSFFNDNSLTMYGSDDVLADFIEIDSSNIQYMDRLKQIALPLITANVIERKFNRELNLLLIGSLDRGVYTRSNFNSYGDEIGHLEKPSLDPSEIPDVVLLQANLNTDSFDILEGFNQKAIRNGGVVLFDFPSLRMQECEKTGLEKYRNLLFTLKASTTIPVLSTPYDRCYPDSYFFDTAYHLNSVGREIRTQQVIKSLSLVLKR